MSQVLHFLLERLVTGIDWINRQAGLISGLILLFMVAVISREAIGRYFFDAPTAWAVELCGYLLVGIVFMSGGYILGENAHLRVDIFYIRFQRRNRVRIDLLGYALGLPYLAFIQWQSILLAWDAYETAERSTIMRWPLYLPELFVPVGVFLMLLQVLAQTVRAVRGLHDPSDDGAKRAQG